MPRHTVACDTRGPFEAARVEDPMHRALATLTALALAALLALRVAAQAPAAAESAAPYVPTPPNLVDHMLELAQVGPGDYVVDLGSGDGRLVIAAVQKRKARGGFGVDIDRDLVALANRNAEQAGVADRVQFRERDLFDTDVGKATVVTLYLLPRVMARLEKKLQAELAPGTRVVSHDYPFPTWVPERTIELDVPEKVRISGTSFTQLLLYRVPARK
jgi:SAM-dependent methyltransferase